MTDEEKQELFSSVDALLAIYDSYSPIAQDGTFDIQKVKSCIHDMALKAMGEGEECSAFLDFIENRSDFYTAPASTRFHGNFESGLAVHSLKVTAQALYFAKGIMESFWTCPGKDVYSVTAQDIFVASLAHDFCKTNTYRVEYRNQKDIFGNWKKIPNYKVRSDYRALGHGNESVLLLLEAVPSYIHRRHVLEAISRHMGFSDLSDSEKYNYSNFLDNPLVVLVQLADETASQWFNL